MLRQASHVVQNKQNTNDAIVAKREDRLLDKYICPAMDQQHAPLLLSSCTKLQMTTDVTITMVWNPCRGRNLDVALNPT